MSPLSDALTAAQQRALNALGKAYVGGQVEQVQYVESLKACGITDPVDIAYLLASLDVLREWGAPVPESNGKPADEPASDKQKALIADLCRRRNQPVPAAVGSKADASQIIDSLQDGSYDPEKWSVPF